MREIITFIIFIFSFNLFSQRMNNDSLVMEEFGVTPMELYESSENTKLLSYTAIGIAGLGILLATNKNSSELSKQNGITLAGFSLSIGIALNLQSRYLRNRSGICKRSH